MIFKKISSSILYFEEVIQCSIKISFSSLCSSKLLFSFIIFRVVSMFSELCHCHNLGKVCPSLIPNSFSYLGSNLKNVSNFKGILLNFNDFCPKSVLRYGTVLSVQFCSLKSVRF